MNVKDWQRLFFAAPAVWVTVDRDGTVMNTYESKEAAELECEYYATKKIRIVIRKENIHSMELSRERWPDIAVAEPAPQREGEEETK